MAIAIANQNPSKLASGPYHTTPATITITAPGNGNTLHFIYSSAALESSFHITAVSSASGSWTLGLRGGYYVNELWSLANCSSGDTALTVTFSADYPGPGDYTVIEVSGMPAALTLNPASSNPGDTDATTQNPASVSLTPSSGAPVFLLAGGCASHNATSGPTGGFTPLTTPASPNFNDLWAYQIVATPNGSTAYSTGWGLSALAHTDLILGCWSGSSGASGGLFRPSQSNGLGSGGPFFANPLG